MVCSNNFLLDALGNVSAHLGSSISIVMYNSFFYFSPLRKCIIFQASWDVFDLPFAAIPWSLYLIGEPWIRFISVSLRL